MRSGGQTWAFLLLAMATTAWQIATLDAAPSWSSDDYAGYIPDTLALLHGGTYGLAKYILNPLVDAAPANYPVGFPLLLTLPVALFGVNWFAIAAYNLLLYGGFLFVWMLYARPLVGPIAAGVIGIALGVSPFTTGFKGQVQSEFAFMLLFAVTLLLAERRRGAGVGLAIAMAAAVLTRLVGGVLLPALPLAVWLRARRLSWRPLLVAGLAGLLVLAGLLAVSPDLFARHLASVNTAIQGGGAAQSGGVLHALPGQILQNLRDLPGNISVFWSDGAALAPLWLALPLKAATAVLLVFGFVGLTIRLFTNPGLTEIFFLLELAALLVLPRQMVGARLYLPLCALLLIYAFDAARALPTMPLIGAPLPSILVGVLLAFPITVNLRSVLAQPADPFTATEPRATAFLDWVRANTAPTDVILCRRTRALVMFTDRYASDYHLTPVDPAFFPWAASIRASTIVLYIDLSEVQALARAQNLPPTIEGLNTALDRYEDRFFSTARGRFSLAFRSDRFRVYRITLSKLN